MCIENRKQTKPHTGAIHCSCGKTTRKALLQCGCIDDSEPKIHKLYNNDIATHYREAEFYLFPSDFKSAFAYWVTHQNPFEKSNADKAIDAFSNHIKKLFKDVEVPQLFTYEELQSIITEKELFKIPEIAALNKTKPDFIDLGALARNIFFMICREKITQN